MDAEGWDRRYATSELVWTGEPNRFLVEEAGDLPAGRALDLGAGEGRNAVWLAARGWTVTAIDFSAVGLEKAQDLAARAGVEIETVVADATAPVAGTYDLVLVFYLHLPEEARSAAARHAAGAVAPGGTLLVVGHDRSNLAEGVGGPQDPAVLFSPEDVTEDLAGRGLVVDRAERVHRQVDTGDGGRTAIDALVRAHRPATGGRTPPR